MGRHDDVVRPAALLEIPAAAGDQSQLRPRTRSVHSRGRKLVPRVQRCCVDGKGCPHSVATQHGDRVAGPERAKSIEDSRPAVPRVQMADDDAAPALSGADAELVPAGMVRLVGPRHGDGPVAGNTNRVEWCPYVNRWDVDAGRHRAGGNCRSVGGESGGAPWLQARQPRGRLDRHGRWCVSGVISRDESDAHDHRGHGQRSCLRRVQEHPENGTRRRRTERTAHRQPHVG